MTTLSEAYWRATVLSVRPLSATMRRVVLGGPGLATWQSSDAPDEWLRLMLPEQRQREVELPVRSGQQWRFANPQPAPRWYSVRRWDEAARELTVDLVVHGGGVATAWVESVEPGDQLVVSQPHGRLHGLADRGLDWIWVIADQTGIPSACRILEALPAGMHAHAVFEAPTEDSTFAPASPADLKACWVYNPHPDTMESPLAPVIRSIELPPGQGFVWMAGEAGCARDVRRYVRHELRWRSQHYDIVGYWRPQQEAYQRRYAAVADEVGQVYDRGRADGRDSEDILDDVFDVMEQRGL